MVGETPIEIQVVMEVGDAGRGVRVTVAGEVDIATSPQLRDACLRAVNEGAGDVHLDLAGVTFLDSSGISVLVQAQQRLVALGRGFELRTVSRPARRVLEIAGLGPAFGLAADPPPDTPPLA